MLFEARTDLRAMLKVVVVVAFVDGVVEVKCDLEQRILVAVDEGKATRVSGIHHTKYLRKFIANYGGAGSED